MSNKKIWVFVPRMLKGKSMERADNFCISVFAESLGEGEKKCLQILDSIGLSAGKLEIKEIHELDE